ncbi:Gmd GDP-D-mannose dehydratase [actinobacterium SCGC AAA044-D11]
MKTAFITGIAGQDGSYLSEYLLEKGYRVTGIIRRNSVVEHQRDRISNLKDVEIKYGDLLDESSLQNALSEFQPDEIYNLAAQSHVRISSDIPQFTVQTNANGTLNLLESYRRVKPDARFYQASSSEMFGSSVDEDGFQRESTPMNPVSPYGCAKVFAYNITRHYREAHGLFISNGILFNHESPRRGSNFVTNKVVKTAVEIKKGIATRLEMGNLDSYRDWGHSYDYVRAMHKILTADETGDYVVATGETHSVRELCQYVFGKLDMNYEDFVFQNPKYLRPQELKYLRGDSTKIRTKLGWKPTYSFETLLDEMTEYWMKILVK